MNKTKISKNLNNQNSRKITRIEKLFKQNFRNSYIENFTFLTFLYTLMQLNSSQHLLRLLTINNLFAHIIFFHSQFESCDRIASSFVSNVTPRAEKRGDM